MPCAARASSPLARTCPAPRPATQPRGGRGTAPTHHASRSSSSSSSGGGGGGSALVLSEEYDSGRRSSLERLRPTRAEQAPARLLLLMVMVLTTRLSFVPLLYCPPRPADSRPHAPTTRAPARPPPRRAPNAR
eukprot:scaffold3886_cov399-Prasinococcus_capsulatus_cf.AAC.12